MRKQTLHKLLVGLPVLVVLGLMAILPHRAIAANPATISFQGKIVNSNGTNITDGTYSVVFRIYNTSNPTMTTSCTSTASCLWQETQASVSVANGIFQVELGSSCALTSSSCNNTAGGPINYSSTNSLYLTMQFNGDTSGSNGGFMYPLIHMNSVPFALYSDNSGALGGFTAANFVQLAQGVQTDSSTTNASIAINKTGGTANILTLQKSNTSVLTLSNSGLLTVQPAASLTAGQTHISESFTNADTTGGTVTGFSQSITVSTGTNAGTTVGHSLTVTDATSLANINKGLSISLGGSNTAQGQYGIDVSASSGVGIRSIVTAAPVAGASLNCASNNGAIAVAVCGDSQATTNGIGVYGRSSSAASSTSSRDGAGVVGYNNAASVGTVVMQGVFGQAFNSGASGAYTSIGVNGIAKASSASAKTYGGYFSLDSSSSTTLGAALYATNSTVAANILDLQDGNAGSGGTNISVFTIADNGVTTAKSNSSTGFQIQDSSNSKSLFTVDTSGDQVVLGMQGASGVNGKIQFNTTNASNTFVALAVASTATSYTITLPTAVSGGAAYCLTSNTSGTTSWTACGAGSTRNVTLSPEFAGATMSGDGTNNVGTMTSDFCSGSGSGGISVNASICDGATASTHNYYSWTASATNDYDIFTQWQAPSDFSSFNSITFNAKVSTTTSDSVALTIYKVGQTTSCGSGTINTGTTWQTSSSISTSGCTIAAGDKLIFDVKLTVGVTNDFARMGEINIVYNRT